MAYWRKFLNSLSQLLLVKFLTSPKVVAVLIFLITSFSVLGMIVPQKFIYSPDYMEEWSQSFPFLSHFAEAVGLTNVFYSWWFLLLLFLFFLSLFLCTLLRCKPSAEKFQKLKPSKIVLIGQKPDADAMKKLFVRRLYRVKLEKSGKVFRFYASRLDSRFFSILFHLGMAVLLLAIAADKSSGLSGSALLTEGETFTERHFDYKTLYEAPFFYENHQFFKVRLESFKVWYEGDVLTDAEAKVRLEDKNLIREELIKVNYPLSYKGFSFLIEKIGFSPLIILSDQKGRVFFSSYVSLGKEKKRSFADFFRLEDYRVELELFPNTANFRRIYLAQLPRLEAKIKRKGKIIWKGNIYQGQVTETPLGTLSFADLRYWVLFQVTYNPLLSLIFFGFFLSVLGLTVRLLFYPLAITLEFKPVGRHWEVGLGAKSRLGKIFEERELKLIEKHLSQW